MRKAKLTASALKDIDNALVYIARRSGHYLTARKFSAKLRGACHNYEAIKGIIGTSGFATGYS